MIRFFLIAFVSAVPAATAFSQSEKSPRDRRDGNDRPARSSQGQPAKKDALQPVAFVMTPGREAAALKFAQIHHPELEKLLLSLRKVNAREFEKAVKRLYQDSERLARIRERLPGRYEAELEAWQLDSRIRLLVARQTMSDDPQLGGKLKELLLERIELRAELARRERERVQSRLDKLDETIRQIERNPEDAALKELQRVKRSLGLTSASENSKSPTRPRRPRPEANPADRPAKKPGGQTRP